MKELSLAHKAEVGLGMKEGDKQVESAASSTGKDPNGWLVGGLAGGDRAFFNGDWLKRAAVAKAGIYANDPAEAMYPMPPRQGKVVGIHPRSYRRSEKLAQDLFSMRNYPARTPIATPICLCLSTVWMRLIVLAVLFLAAACQPEPRQSVPASEKTTEAPKDAHAVGSALNGRTICSSSGNLVSRDGPPASTVLKVHAGAAWWAKINDDHFGVIGYGDGMSWRMSLEAFDLDAVVKQFKSQVSPHRPVGVSYKAEFFTAGRVEVCWASHPAPIAGIFELFRRRCDWGVVSRDISKPLGDFWRKFPPTPVSLPWDHREPYPVVEIASQPGGLWTITINRSGDGNMAYGSGPGWHFAEGTFDATATVAGLKAGKGGPYSVEILEMDGNAKLQWAQETTDAAAVEQVFEIFRKGAKAGKTLPEVATVIGDLWDRYPPMVHSKPWYDKGERPVVRASAIQTAGLAGAEKEMIAVIKEDGSGYGGYWNLAWFPPGTFDVRTILGGMKAKLSRAPPRFVPGDSLYKATFFDGETKETLFAHERGAVIEVFEVFRKACRDGKGEGCKHFEAGWRLLGPTVMRKQWDDK